MKVGIVTFEFPGFSKNGGIGTAYGRLAHLLKSNGHEVTVYLVDIYSWGRKEPIKLAPVRKANPGIKIELVATPKSINDVNSWPTARALSVYEHVRHAELDILHFHDCLGFGYYCLSAQKQDLHFQNTKIIVGLHGPTFWSEDAQGFLPRDPNEYLLQRLERKSVEMAEHVVSPSQYLVDYLKDWGWKFSKEPKVLPNVNSFENSAWAKASRVESHKISKLVFFGRLEPRKGLYIFLDALELLTQKKEKWPSSHLEVVFLGKSITLDDGQKTEALVRKHVKQLKSHFSFQFHTDFTSEDCKKFFKKNPDSLICIPSIMDNSPYSVLEAIEQNLNFLTTSSGGQSELIHPDNHFDTVAKPKAPAFADKILYKLNSEYPLARPNPTVLAANQEWLTLHSETKSIRKSTKKYTKAGNKIGIILTSGPGAADIGWTLDSLKTQTTQPHEVVVMKWGPQDPKEKWTYRAIKHSYRTSKWKFLETADSNPKDVFKRAFAETKSDYLMFLSAGDILYSDSLAAATSMLRREQHDICFFGLRSLLLECYPPPFELNYSLFFDSYGKFPTLIRRRFISQTIFDFESDIKISTTGALVSFFEKKNKIAVMPKVFLQNRNRPLFNPHVMASQSEVRSRIRALSPVLPLEYVRNLELAAGLLVEKSKSQS